MPASTEYVVYTSEYEDDDRGHRGVFKTKHDVVAYLATCEEHDLHDLFVLESTGGTEEDPRTWSADEFIDAFAARHSKQ